MARTEASDSLAGAGKGWRVGGSRAGWSTFSPGSWPQSDRLLAARKLLRALTARDDGRTVRIVFLQSNFYGYSTIIGVSQPLNCLRNGRISSLCLGAFAKCCRLGLSVKMSGAIVVLVVLVIIYPTLQDAAVVSCQPRPGPSLTALLISTPNWLIHSWESWPTEREGERAVFCWFCLVSSTWILFAVSLSLTHCRFI